MFDLDIQAAGDRAFRLSFGNEVSEVINEKVIEAASFIRNHKNPAIKEVSPSYCSLLIRYDPIKMNYSDMKLFLEYILKELDGGLKRKKEIIKIPVCFEEEYGIDLDYLAKKADLSREETVSLFCSRDYRVYLFGTEPAFSYSGLTDEKLEAEARALKHKTIEAGSIVLWDRNVGIYNLPSSGNQRIIGRTPLKLYKDNREEIFLYRPGDYLRFYPVSEEDFKQIVESVNLGTYKVTRLEEDIVWA